MENCTWKHRTDRPTTFCFWCTSSTLIPLFPFFLSLSHTHFFLSFSSHISFSPPLLHFLSSENSFLSFPFNRSSNGMNGITIHRINKFQWPLFLFSVHRLINRSSPNCHGLFGFFSLFPLYLSSPSSLSSFPDDHLSSNSIEYCSSSFQQLFFTLEPSFNWLSHLLFRFDSFGCWLFQTFTFFQKSFLTLFLLSVLFHPFSLANQLNYQ